MSDQSLSRDSGDSYLWDRSGEPHPQLLQWETLLSEVRAAAPLRDAPRFEGADGLIAPRAVRLRQPNLLRLAREILPLAAGLLLAVTAGVLWYTLRDTGIAVEILAGSPTLSGMPIAERTAVVPGATVQTDGAAEARLRIGRIGWVDVRPDSAVQVLVAEEDAYRLSIRHGSVRADISAAPRVFVVDIPYATAIDLGCVYELVANETGEGSLTVQSGWVAFESPGRQALVPEGGRALSRGRAGVGSPYYLDASPEFVASLALVDFPAEVGAGSSRAALTRVLAGARERDALTLLTLLRRVDGDGRLLIYDRLRVLLRPPAGVTRAGIAAGDIAMIDAWWEALGLKFDKKPPVALSRG